MAHLLIDADILVYRVGFSCESKLPDGTLLVEPEEVALERMNKLYDEIFAACGGGMYTSYLTSTDKSNFRFTLFPGYKGSRKQPKPVHYNLLRAEVENHWNGVVVYGQEADDEIGIASTADPDSIIVTIDKDLDQLPRWHYNFVKKERYSVSELGAIRNFYLQVLEGDNGDDVKGCPKIGKAKSMRYLEGCENEPEMLRVVLGLYEKHHDDEWLDHLLLAGKLLWLRRYPNQPWTLTNGEAASKESLVKHSSNFEFPTTMSQEQLTM